MSSRALLLASGRASGSFHVAFTYPASPLAFSEKTFFSFAAFAFMRGNQFYGIIRKAYKNAIEKKKRKILTRA
ncbi:MAG: hypothetical protein WBL87_06005 [Methanothrix sp.]